MDYTNIIIASCTGIATVITTVGFISKIIGKKFDRIDNQFKEINNKLNDIDDRLNSLDQRLSRLEGAFVERGQWEGKMYVMQKTITEEKK